jgi:uncharacterized coiled-coil protein SlyX
MANRILRRLAIAAGTGLATINSGRIRTIPEDSDSPPYPTTPDPPAPEPALQVSRVEPGDDFLNLNIDPLLDRLEAIEAQIEMFERKAVASADRLQALDEYAARLGALERRVEENARSLTALRESINAAERTSANRTDDLRERLRTGILAQTGHIERSLAEQTGSIEAIGARVTETENSLQRLAMALEKLCERAQLLMPGPDIRAAHSPASPSVPSDSRLPFETQLDDALRRDPVIPVLRTKEPVEAPPPKKARLFSSAWWSPD